MNNLTQVLSQLAAALENGPFKVTRGAELPDGTTADITASRTYISWKGLVILSQHIVVKHIDNATQDDAKALFEAGFQFGKKTNKIPLLRGLQFGYMIIPVIVGESPSAGLIKSVSQCPAKHWSLFEYPVVVNLSDNQAQYFSGTAVWGGFFFSDMRKVVETYINNSLANQATVASLPGPNG